MIETHKVKGPKRFLKYSYIYMCVGLCCMIAGFTSSFLSGLYLASRVDILTHSVISFGVMAFGMAAFSMLCFVGLLLDFAKYAKDHNRENGYSPSE